MTWRLRKLKSILDYLKKIPPRKLSIKSLNKNFSANIILRTKKEKERGSPYSSCILHMITNYVFKKIYKKEWKKTHISLLSM